MLSPNRAAFTTFVSLAATIVSCATPGPTKEKIEPTDPYRPVLHFTAQRGWINDPNGLVFYEGQWHLGYQAGWPRTWGHAVSRDLFAWTELRPILQPDETGDMWSGSTVVDWHDTTGWFQGGSGLVAAFTAWGPQSAAPGDKRQSVGLAFSADGGTSFTKFAANPVALDPHSKDFRDPKVFWYQPSQQWIAVVTVGRAMRIYSSADLKAWTLQTTFAQDLLPADVQWECPDLFPLKAVVGSSRVEKWVLMASYVSQGNFATPQRFGNFGERYFVGSFDGKTFIPDSPMQETLEASFGDTYATVSWSDVPADDGRRVAIGWMNHWGYAKALPTSGWQGALSLPRVLSLKATEAGFRLRQSAAVELEALRMPGTQLRDVPLQGSQVLDGIHTDVGEVIVDIDVADAKEVGIRVRAGGTHETVIGYRIDKQELFVDRTASGRTDFHDAFAQRLRAPLPISNGRLKLHVVVDRSSVEVFADDGAAYLAALIFPHPDDQAVGVYSQGGAARLRSLYFFPSRRPDATPTARRGGAGDLR